MCTLDPDDSCRRRHRDTHADENAHHNQNSRSIPHGYANQNRDTNADRAGNENGNENAHGYQNQNADADKIRHGGSTTPCREPSFSRRCRCGEPFTELDASRRWAGTE